MRDEERMSFHCQTKTPCNGIGWSLPSSQSYRCRGMTVAAKDVLLALHAREVVIYDVVVSSSSLLIVPSCDYN